MRYTIHSMHGPTVMEFNSLELALKRLFDLKLSNGGVYRIVDEYGKEYASIDTYATYWPLCNEWNKKRSENA